MHASLLTLLFTCTIFNFSHAQDLDLPFVLDAGGVPECIQACLSDLFYSAAELVYLQNPVEKFRELCRTYDNASQCIEDQKDTCYQTTVFDIALSGLDEVCNEREEDWMEHKDCLEVHSEVVLKNCDHQCHFTDVMITLSGKGNPKGLQKLQEDQEALQKELASVCTSFGCMSSCAARDLNINCSPVGTIIVEALLKPFFTIATIFEEIGPRAKISIYRQVPSQCYYLVDYEEVHGISHGKPPSKMTSKNPEEAVLNEITTKEEMKKKKKAELEKMFLMEARKGLSFFVEDKDIVAWHNLELHNSISCTTLTTLSSVFT
ncbi:hypothetical protein Aduo_011158 [Ancylostoma duodenale]